MSVSNSTLFSWQGIDRAGQRLTGRNFAKSKTELKYRLHQQQIITNKINYQTNLFITLRRWLSNKQTLFFLTQLNALLKTGLNLHKTVSILNHNCKEPVLTELLDCLNNGLSKGEKLSTVLSLFPILFDQITIQLIKSGEKSGQLDQAIQQATTHLSQKRRTTNQLLTAMLYPLMLIIVSFSVLATLVIFVIPQFESIYSQSGAQLPWITVSILRTCDGIRTYSPWFFFIISSLYFINLFVSQKKKYFQFLKYIPKVNKTIKKFNTLRFSQTISSLYKSGLTITDCLEACRKLAKDNNYQSAISNTLIQIKKGHGLANALENSQYFDQLMIQLIRTGEESANLGAMLDQCSSYFYSELQDSLNRIKILLEPLLIVILGVIIGFILVAMYLPIFNLGTSF